MPLTPTIAGFDPQLQFVEQDDVIRAIEFVVDQRLEGVYNVAGDGRLPWSEVRGHRRQAAALLSPVLTAAGRRPAQPPGPGQPPARDARPAALRPGRRQPQAQGGRVRLPLHHAGAVGSFVGAQPPAARGGRDATPTYHYQGDVETFFRSFAWRSSARPISAGRSRMPTWPVAGSLARCPSPRR